MKAAVCNQFGPATNIKIQDVPSPSPAAGEVLVRVIASTVDIADVRVRALRVPAGLSIPTRLAMGPFRPKYPVLGLQLSGVIEAVGEGVSFFVVGDEVVGSSGFKFGCHAEYVCLDVQGAIARKPKECSHEEAVSMLFGGSTAEAYFDSVGLKKGDKILINGASGAVGVAAVQLAKYRGAHVTAVCSGKNTALVTELGADNVIDYTKADFKSSGSKFDYIMDNVGNAPFAEIEHLLEPNGKLLVVIFKNAWQMILNGFNKRAILLTGEDEKKVMSAKMYEQLMRYAQEGGLKPVIDAVYSLDQIVAAHNHVDTGHKVGSVVVKIAA